MNKKLLVLLFAGLLLVSAAACSKKNPNEYEASGTDPETIVDPFNNDTTPVVVGTDTNGEDITIYEPVTQPPIDDNTSEPNAVFTDINKKIYVWTGVATVRTDTIIADNTGCAWPKEGTTFDATGESKNWYRINYGGKVCYIAKNVVCDASLLDGFRTVDETITIESNVNVRSIPSTASEKSIRGVLKKGAQVKRIGVGDKWSVIEYEMASETETDATTGKAKIEVKHYYISNDCIVDPSAATDADTTAQ